MTKVFPRTVLLHIRSGIPHLAVTNDKEITLFLINHDTSRDTHCQTLYSPDDIQAFYEDTHTGHTEKIKQQRVSKKPVKKTPAKKGGKKRA
jgi:hypothetical protein